MSRMKLIFSLLTVLLPIVTWATDGGGEYDEVIQDATNCHLYEIIRKESSGYQAARMTCSNGTFFHPTYKKCIVEDPYIPCQAPLGYTDEKSAQDCYTLGETMCLDCEFIKLCNQDLYGNKKYQTIACPQGTYCNRETNNCEACVPRCSRFSCAQDGLFPDNIDCARYHECQNNFTDVIKLCSPGSSFNPATGLCDLPLDEYSCFEPLAHCDVQYDWQYHPIRGSCLTFYICNDWEPEFHKCPPGKALMCRQTSTTSSTRTTRTTPHWKPTTTPYWWHSTTRNWSPTTTPYWWHTTTPYWWHTTTPYWWHSTTRNWSPTTTPYWRTTTTRPTSTPPTTSMPSGPCQCVSLAEITDKKCLQEAEFHGEICFKSGYVPDPMEACPTRAFLCAQNGTKDGHPYFSLVYTVNCPDGQAFDRYSDTCQDYEDVVHCRIEDVCAYGGNHGYPADGKKFYHCKWPGDMDPEIITCPDDLIYNKATGICDFKHVKKY